MLQGLFRGEHLLIILVLVLLVFGPSRLPQLGGSLGRTIRDFKKGISESVNDEKAGDQSGK